MRLSGATRGMTLVAPVLRKNALRVVDPALRGHPLLGVEAVTVERELGFVDRHPARKRVDKWLQRLPIEKSARRTGHQERRRGGRSRRECGARPRRAPGNTSKSFGLRTLDW